ncbi:MAG: UDP-3-O-acyl-N-acetylglucosamine deacetylase [Halanaerobiaceae bacterium]
MPVGDSKQKTICSPIEYSGIALHTGKEVSIKFLPAEANQGIVFRRVDSPGNPDIEAVPENVVSTKRCTSIGLVENEELTIHTIEHLMAALWSMGIDNITIEIDDAETPVGDGSALPFVKLFNEAGVKELSESRCIRKIESPIWVKKDDMYLVVLPYDGFKVTYTLVYDHPVIGIQFYEYDYNNGDFFKDLASARTFGFEKEVEALHRRGLALGGSLDNAVLIGDNDTINPMRFENEFVRHKVLDIIGDMFLNGFIEGHIMAVRSGHFLHVELAKKIREQTVSGG